MKALILNSGIGKRMGTGQRPKGLLMLLNGETVLQRQVRILGECGIRDFVITTGPEREQIAGIADRFPDYQFTFVFNPDYQSTNYIVSMYLAKDDLDDDCLFLHGDLVFNKNLVVRLLACKEESVCLYHEDKPLPEKDFKAEFQDGHLKYVGVDLFTPQCYAFQPLYKLSRSCLQRWLKQIAVFIAGGRTGVYAENALNECTAELKIRGMSYKDDYIEEIDDQADYDRVTEEIRYVDRRDQEIKITDDFGPELDVVLKAGGIRKVFLVCGNSSEQRIRSFLAEYKYDFTLFQDFSPNPQVADVRRGTELFCASGCAAIAAIGGGSAIDTAKGIKLMSVSDGEDDFFHNRHNYNAARLIAIPTTAGSGSESTRFAVLYDGQEKISITHDSILPDHAILCAPLLDTLPDYQKKATLLDALCQAVESYWARGADEFSKAYAGQAITLILNHYKQYLQNDESAARAIMQAANLSGRAINISRTTLPHAMSYRLTSQYGISHGHAVGWALGAVWQDMAEHDIPDSLKCRMVKLCRIFGSGDMAGAAAEYKQIYDFMELGIPVIRVGDIPSLVASVNPERMENHPVAYDQAGLWRIYLKLAIRENADYNKP